MAKYSSFSPLEEQENELDGQYQKIPADSNPCRNQQKKRAGEAASAVKVSSKKRKRMEKFIVKHQDEES